MSAWIVIAKSQLQQYLVDAQLSALVEAALGDGQADPFSATMQDRCNYIRNRISGRVQLSATAFAIPPELITTAVMLIIESLQVRLAPGLSLKDDQKRMIERAYKDLDIAGTNELPISAADDAITATVQGAQGGITIVKKPSRQQTRDSFNGL